KLFEARGQRCRLGVPGLGQRRIGLALNPAFAVVNAFGVPDTVQNHRQSSPRGTKRRTAAAAVCIPPSAVGFPFSPSWPADRAGGGVDYANPAAEGNLG